MKIRGSDKAGEKIEPQMAPMIDVVFQLLIFFMLTLKIIEPEGAVNVNMPSGEPTSSANDPLLTPIKVRLISNESGQLVELLFGGAPKGNGEAAYVALNKEIRDYVDNLQASGAPMDDVEAEIDADPELHWNHTMKAISAVRGHLDTSQNPARVVPLIEKIKFAPPREEGGGTAG